jgi:erythrocyte band 7 integral membrane protein
VPNLLWGVLHGDRPNLRLLRLPVLLRLRTPDRQGYSQPHPAGLVESFGKFSRMLKPGINLINPCAEEVTEVELRIIGLPVGKHPTITKDQVKVDVDASLSYRVTNPVVAHYVLGANLKRALVELTISSLRDVIGTYNLDQLLSERFEVSQKAKDLVIAGMPPGVKVHNVFIDELIIPYQTEKDLTSAARQKRLSEAIIISNKADVEAAALMQESAKLLDSKVAMQIRYLEMIKNLGEKSKTSPS